MNLNTPLDDNDGHIIVQAILSLSKSFQRRTVAEGVETAELEQQLLNLGCNIAQGFDYGRPVVPLTLWRGLRTFIKPRTDAMLGYVTIGVNDMAKAKTFYTELLSGLGAKLLLDMDRIAFIGNSMKEPMLAVCDPFNGEAPNPGNGNMLAFQPGSKEAVDTYYQKAIELGASCAGAPGQRIPDQFYGAYVKDPDGNKLAFCCFG